MEVLNFKSFGRTRWVITLIAALALVFTGLTPAEATHLRGAVGTVTYDAAAKTVTVNSLMIERKDACLTYSATNSMCTTFAFPTITQVNRSTGAVVGTVTACTGQNTRPTYLNYDNTSDPLFNIFTTTYVVDVSCPTFTTAFDYVFSQTGNNRIGGIKNSTNQTIQFEARVSFAASNSTPFYNSGYQTNVAYDADPTHFFTTNLNALSSQGKSVTYQLVTSQASALGGYGASRVPCSDLNTTTGVFRVSASLCQGTENYATAFNGGSDTTPLYYVLKTKAIDEIGQYTTRDVLLQFSNTSNAKPVVSRTGVTASSVTLTKGQSTTITYTATDANATQLLSWSTNTLPAWATFTWTSHVSPATATLVLNPPLSAADQAFTLQVTATDNGAFPLSATNNLDVTVGSSVVLPPGSPGTPTVSGVHTSTTLSATFALPTTGGTASSYSLTATPTTAGASVTVTCAAPSSGTTQTCSIPGVLSSLYYTVVVTAINSSGSASSAPSLLTVPILSIDTASITMSAGTAYPTSLYTITNTGGPATYALTSGTLPAGSLSISSVNGGLTGTPSTATTGSGNVLTITATNSSTGETAAISVTVSVTQTAGAPALTFPSIGFIYKTGSSTPLTTPTWNAATSTISGNWVPLRAYSKNSSTPIKYSVTSNPTTSSQWQTTGTANSAYVPPTLSSGTTGACVLVNVNGVVYAGYAYSGTKTSVTTACTIYANQDASAGWNKATQVSQSLFVDRSSTTWSSSSVPSATISPSAITGTVGTALALGNLGLTYSTSSSTVTYAAQSCTLPSSPALPAGITFNTQTCVLSGTPTALQALTTYTVTLKNGTANTATKTFTIAIAGKPQTIAFVQGPVSSILSTFNLTGTATSGLTPVYTSSTPLICTVSGVTVTPVSTGTCTIQAAQPGDGVTWAAAAPNVSQSFALGANVPVLTLNSGTSADKTVNVLDPMASAISFTDTQNTAVLYKLYDASGLELTTLPDGLSFDSTKGTLFGSPEVKQSKTAYYIIGYNVNNVASNKLSFTLTILALSQTIDFPQPQAMVLGQRDQGIGAIASSSMAVTLTTTSPSICRINADGTVTALSAGTCSITATQPGDGKAYLAATPVTRTFTVSASLAAPSITLTQTEIVITVGAPFPLPFDTINTGGAATYKISPALPTGLVFDPNYGVIANSIATITSPRTQYTITASNTSSGTVQTDSKSFWLTVVGTPQNIALTSTNSSLLVSATSTPTTQAIRYVPDTQSLLAATSILVTTGAGTVCSLDQATLVITAIAYGTCVITATQAGNATYSSASTTLTINVHQAPGFSLIPTSLTYTVGDTVLSPFTISTSGDPVTFQLRNSAGAVTTIPGLTFNTATGQLSGIATTAQVLTTYTVAAINAYGENTKTFQLVINAATQPMVLSFSNSSASTSLTLTGLTIGVAASPAYTIYNTGTLATSYAFTGATAAACLSAVNGAGLTFNTANGQISGTPTAKFASNACTITGTNPGSGTAITSSVTLTLNSSTIATGAPVVVTTSASTSNGTSWTLSGTANMSGATTGGTVQFCYSSSPTLATSTCVNQSGTITYSGAVSYSSAAVTGLTAGTTLYYRIQASNGGSVVNGAIVAFNPYALPVVATSSPTQISSTSYTLNGTVDNKNSATTDIHFCFSTSNATTGGILNGCSTSQVSVPNIGVTNGISTALPVSATLIVSSANPTYWYQLVATNAAGTSASTPASITTASVPVVATGDPTAVGSTTATIGGLVNPGNASTTYAVCFGTSAVAANSTACPYPTSGLPTALTGVLDNSVQVALTGLTTRTLYYYRLMAKNSQGVTYGDQLSFMTTGTTLVQVGTAVQLSDTSFQLVGTVNPGGLATTSVQFCYSESTSDFAHCTPVAMPNLLAGVTAQTVTRNVSGLAAGTTYNFWLSADNGLGNQTSSTYGTFTTGNPTSIATLTPLANSSITSNSANANVTLSTGNLATSVYVCYGLSADLTSCTYSLLGSYSASTGTSNVTFNLSGLSAGTKYYYSFKAVNSLGVVLSNGNVTTTGSTTPLSITTTSLSAGVVAQAYSSTVVATGGLAPYTWSVASGLPSGLAINYATGEIYGSPVVAGTFNFNVSATDSAGRSVSKAFTVVITAAAVPLAISTTQTDFPTATVNSVYSFSFVRVGGLAPYTWSLASGTLPTGLSLGANGALSGTPTATGIFNFVVRVTDSTSGTAQSVTKSFTIGVAAQPLTATTSSLAIATEGVAYSEPLTASGGTTPYTWALAPGNTLPAGLSVSGGNITGTPTAGSSAGTYTVQFVVTDNANSTAQTVALTLTVIGEPTFDNTPSDSGTSSTQTTLSVDATSGNTLTTYSICYSTSAALSVATCNTNNSWVLVATDSQNVTTTISKFLGGLTLGTTYYYFFRATNAVTVAKATPIYTAQSSFATTSTLGVSTTSLAQGTEGSNYSQTLTSAGGTGTKTWTLVSGTLPTGLSLSSSGVISGTPAAGTMGSVDLVFRVTDGAVTPATADSITLTLTIVAAASVANPGVENLKTTQADIYVTVNPGNLLTAVSYCYSKVQADVTNCTNWTPVDSGSISGIGNFKVSQHLTNLTPNTQYYFRFRVVNAATGVNGITTVSLRAASLSRTAGSLGSSSTSAGTLRYATAPSSFVTPPALAITTPSLPAATLGTGYNQLLAGTGGTEPYSWSLTSGFLPPGLTLNSMQGQILGTPTAIGNYTFTVALDDSIGSTQTTATYTIVVGAVPTVQVNAESGLSYSTITLNATVNTKNFATTVYYCVATTLSAVNSCTWTQLSTVQSASLSTSDIAIPLSNLSPSQGYFYRIRVVNAAGESISDPTNFTTAAAPVGLTITPTSDDTTKEGQAFAGKQFTKSGGTGTITWSLTGTLPTGITFNTSTGLLSGTPALGTTGDYSVTVTVSDSTSATSSLTYVLSVYGDPSSTTATPSKTYTTASWTTTPSTGNLSTTVTYCVVTTNDVNACSSFASIATVAAGSTAPVTQSITGLTPGTTYYLFVRTSNSSGTVTSSSIAITTKSLPSITTTGALTTRSVGQSGVVNQIVAINGSGTYPTWSISQGELPIGVTLNSATGLISGTPAAGEAGTHTFKVMVTDSDGNTAESSTLSMKIIDLPLLTFFHILGPTSQGATVSVHANAQNDATAVTVCVNTVNDFTSCTPETLASGLLGITDTQVDKVMNGLTPGQTYYYRFVATNSVGSSTAVTGSFTTTLGASFVTTTLPNGTIASPYTTTLHADGGSGTFRTWVIKSGTLPAGLTLDDRTGVISGTPTATGTSTLVFTATDTSTPGLSADSVSMTLVIDAAAPLVITSSSTGTGSANVSATYTFTNTGGVAPYTWSVSSGVLPAGMTLSSSGVLSGTVTTVGTYTFTIRLSDAVGSAVSTQVFTLTISAPATAVTGTATAVNDHSAILHGVVNPGNADTTYYFCYSTLESLVGCTQTNSVTLVAGALTDATADQNVETTVTGLTGGTVYYFKVFAQNAATPQPVSDPAPLNLQTTSAASIVNNPPSTPNPPVNPPVVQPLPPLGPVGPSGIPAPLTALITQSGASHTVPLVPNAAGTELSAGEYGWTLKWSMLTAAGGATQLNAKHQLIVQLGQWAHAAGTGFKPNTDVHIYIFSSPQLLGILKTDDAGKFTGEVMTPSNLTIGEHILQITGYTLDGVIRTADIAVEARATAQKVSTTALQFDANSAKLTASSMKTLKKLVASFGSKYSKLTATAVGFVYPTAQSKNDISLSSARAKAVNAYLQKLGLKGTYFARGGGRLSAANAWSRRVNLTISYTP